MKRFLASTIAVLILLGTVTCGAAKSKTVAVTSVKLSKASVSFITSTVQPQSTLKATVSPSNATNKAVKWSTSDSTVATVTNGIVSAVAYGTCNITATAGNKKAVCTVTVDNKHWSDGTYTVGKDIPAAEYILVSAVGSNGKITIISNLFQSPINDNFENREYVTLVVDETLTVSNGKMYTVANAPAVKKINGAYPAGMYKVDTDIPVSTYNITAVSSSAINAAYIVYNDSTHYPTDDHVNTGGVVSNTCRFAFSPIKYAISGHWYIKLTDCTMAPSK